MDGHLDVNSTDEWFVICCREKVRSNHYFYIIFIVDGSYKPNVGKDEVRDLQASLYA